VLLLAAVAFLVFRGGDEDEPVADEVRLVAVTDQGGDPWTDNFDTGNDGLERFDIALTGVPEIDDNTADPLGAAVNGDEPGLFGGVRDQIACDKDGLAGQLGDGDLAEAFADVQGIDASDVAGFINDLTAVFLRLDVRLGDHGFVDGDAESFEAVLEKGTAVLVDTLGVPRVRCASGSPLVPGRSTGDTETFDGTQWPGFDESRIVVILGTAVTEGFVLVDNDTEDVFVRPVGSAGDGDEAASVDLACLVNPESATCGEGGPESSTTTEPELGTGEVQFTLRWGSTADMDLAVTDPTGTRIDYVNDTAPSGGQLDVDANANCGSEDPPVENVYWRSGAPTGTYTVEVKLYDDCDNGSQDFELSALIGGETTSETGTLTDDSEVVTFTFDL
jgi:hypothetical protein